VPDATTVWLFRERLVQAKAIDKLFVRFDAALKDRGYLAMGGQIIDATVPAPKQRNTEAEKAAIKEGRVPEEEASEGAAKGPRCALVDQIQQSQSSGGCRSQGGQTG
jgi:IS5 family transposase